MTKGAVRVADGREVDQGELLGVAKDEKRARSLLRGDLTVEPAFTDPECTAALDLPDGDPINIDIKRWPDD